MQRLMNGICCFNGLIRLVGTFNAFRYAALKPAGPLHRDNAVDGKPRKCTCSQDRCGRSMHSTMHGSQATRVYKLLAWAHRKGPGPVFTVCEQVIEHTEWHLPSKRQAIGLEPGLLLAWRQHMLHSICVN